AAGGHERSGLAAARTAPALAGQRDVTALEQPVLVVLIVLEGPDRTFGAGRAVAVAAIDRTARSERAVLVLPAPYRVSVVFREIGRRFPGVLAPRIGAVRANELGGEQRVAIV